MDAGEFDRKITLQRKLEADDGYSSVDNEWRAICAPIWAKLIPMSGREILAAAENAAFANVRYKIRNDSLWSDLNASDRMLDENGAVCDIISVRSEGRRFFLIDAVKRGDG